MVCVGVCGKGIMPLVPAVYEAFETQITEVNEINVCSREPMLVDILLILLMQVFAARKAIFFPLLELLELLELSHPGCPLLWNCCCCWAAETTRILSHNRHPEACFIQRKVGKIYSLINSEKRSDEIDVRGMFRYEYKSEWNKGTPSRKPLRSKSGSARCVSFVSSQVPNKKSYKCGKIMVFSWDRDSRAQFICFLSSSD